MEEQDIVLACGRWRVDKKRWLFDVDTNKGCRIIVADKETKFEDFTAMVYDDFGFCEGTFAIKLSYMLDRYKKSGCYLPPVIVSNGRQFQNFLKQSRGELIRLCVEIEAKYGETFFEEVKPKTPEPTPKTPEVVVDDFVGVAEEMGQKDDEYESRKVDGEDNVGNDVDEDEADDEDNSRFDYCDDSDGASSGDEDYLLYSNFAPDGAEEEVCNKESNNRTRKTNSAADAVEKEVHKIENRGGDIVVGDKFDSKETLVARFRVLSVLDKYDYNVRYSTPSLLIVECWVKGCKWRIRASTMGDSPVFHIRKYFREHTCSVTERYGRSRNAKPPILAQLYKDYVGGVGGSVVPNLVGEGLNLRYGVQFGYWKAHRTLIKAWEYVRGTPESGYAELPAYLHSLRSSNLGTLTRLVVDAEESFKYVFIAIARCIKGFRYMRKVVVVYGTFLKGEIKGTLLIAITQDGNFNIFSLAYAVVDTENDVSWEWFFMQLSSVIPDDEELALISDRHKSIGKAIAKVYPLTSRGICTYHLHKNIILKFSGSETFRLVKKAAVAYRVVDFEEIFHQIQEANPQLHAYLVRADESKWSRAHFPGDRYNFTTSNIAESLNKVLNPARAYPIVELLEAVRNMLTRWFATRRKQAAAIPTFLTKGVENLLQARIEHSRRLRVQEIDEDRFQVSCGTSTHVVNLRYKRCSCRRFDLERMPCVHAIAAAYTANQSVINQFHPYFRRDSLCSGYAESIMPIDTSCIVPTDVTPSRCIPPFVRNPPGRPKMSRMKSFVEVALETKRPRKQHACSQCQQVGHNRTTCRAYT